MELPFLDLIFNWGSELLSAEVTKMTLAFMIAARLHRAWVRKDMSEQFGLLRQSIEHVADSLGRRLDAHEVRLDKLENK